MKTYIVTAPMGAALPIETEVKLTESQAAAREHAVVRVKGKKDVYLTTAAISFKRGETIQTDADMPKNLMSDITPANSDAGKAVAAEAAARAEKPGLLAQVGAALGFGQAPPGAGPVTDGGTGLLTPPV